MNRVATTLACFALALPAALAAKHPDACHTLRVIVAPKPGYTCHTVEGRWLVNHNIRWHDHDQHFTLNPGDRKSLGFEVRGPIVASEVPQHGSVGMTFVCSPVDGSGPKKNITIDSAMRLKHVQPCGLFDFDCVHPSGYKVSLTGASNHASAATILSRNIETNPYGYCTGASTITWELGG